MGFLNFYLKDIGGGQRAYVDGAYDDEGTNDGYKWSDAASEVGYIKTTDPVVFIDLGAIDFDGADFIAKKDCLKMIVTAFGGGNEDAGVDLMPNSTYKQFLASLLIGSNSKRIEVFAGNFEALKAATVSYHPKAQKCRHLRLDNAIVDGHTFVPQYMLEILSDTGMILDWYVQQGIKGQPYDPAEYGYGLSNYMNGIAPYDGVTIVPHLGRTCIGLINKGWTTLSGMNMTDYVAKWNDILFESGMPTS